MDTDNETKITPAIPPNKVPKNYFKTTITAMLVILALLIIAVFVPLTRVPVKVMETYYESEVHQVTDTQAVTAYEPYTQVTPVEQTVVGGEILGVGANTYSIYSLPVDVAGKTNPRFTGSFSATDGRSVHFMVFDRYPSEIHPGIFLPRPIYEERDSFGSFAFTPVSGEYYFIIDSYTYYTPRVFSLSARLSWDDITNGYRPVTETRNVEKQVSVPVAKQREVIKYEPRSLFQLIRGY